MSGIIFGNMMSGLGQGVANYGSMMERERAIEEERAARLALQREQMRAREDLQRERIQASAARAPAGRERLTLEPGSDQEAMVAANMGKSVPELRQLMQAVKTGDFSAYGEKVDVMERKGVGELDVSGDTSDAVSRGTAKLEKTGERTEFSPKWESEKREMLTKLGREMAGMVYGKDYKDIAEGQSKALESSNLQGVISGNLPAEAVNRASIATKGGKLYENMGEAGTFDVSSGKAELNDLGRAKQRAQNSRAEAPRSSGDGGGKKPVLRSTRDIDGRTYAIMSDGNKIDLGPSQAFNKSVGDMILRKEKEDSAFRKLPPEEKRRIVSQDLLGASPPSSSAPTPPKSGDNKGIVNSPQSRKVGETRTVQSGPNKGKTVEWDGEGWVLKQ